MTSASEITLHLLNISLGIYFAWELGGLQKSIRTWYENNVNEQTTLYQKTHEAASRRQFSFSRVKAQINHFIASEAQYKLFSQLMVQTWL